MSAVKLLPVISINTSYSQFYQQCMVIYSFPQNKNFIFGIGCNYDYCCYNKVIEYVYKNLTFKLPNLT